MAGNKKKGRPKGSRNFEYVVIHAQPVRCPNRKCLSTNLVPVEGAAPTIKEIGGVAPDGVRYDATKWQRSKCGACGQRVTILSRLTENNNTADIITS